MIKSMTMALNKSAVLVRQCYDKCELDTLSYPPYLNPYKSTTRHHA